MEGGTQTTGSGCSRTVYAVCFVLGLVSLILHIVGLATPGWLIMYVSTRAIKYDISMGLWVVNYCIDGECGSKGIREFWDDFFTGTTNALGTTLDEYRAETILGAISMLIVLVLLLVLMCRRATGGQHNNKWMLVLSSICSAISAFLALLASGKWGKKVADAHALLGYLSPYLVPYSPYVTGTAGILAFIIFLILAITAFREYQRTSMNQGQTVAMATYPHGSQPYVIQSNNPLAYGAPPYNSYTHASSKPGQVHSNYHAPRGVGSQKYKHSSNRSFVM